MSLIDLRHIELAFGGPPLLDDIALRIEAGERIGLLGRNGTGKSTLLKILAGELPPDRGTIDRRQGLRTALLAQDVPADLHGSVFQAVAAGLGPAGERLGRYHQLSRSVATATAERMAALSELQQAIEGEDGWRLQQNVEQALSRLRLDGDAAVATLSGGVLRRVLLARALAQEPDILLLDEPTNHLDIASIVWLEEFLRRSALTLVFVTHDRAFLRSLATRIIEVDRGRLYDFAGDYETFLLRKEEVLHAEAREWERFDKKLAEEEVWIRKGIKARRTRNEGRVRALQQMRAERRQRRDRLGAARLQLHEAERSGKLVAEVTGLSFAWDGRPIVKDVSTTILRGDRIGIIGPNGAGKTTLLKLLLGELRPDAGEVRLGTNLQILYFDQLREQLDPDLTVQQNLAGDQDHVLVGGRSRHVIGYLQDFLFTPDRARTPVRILSGGERNRLLLARLFTREANVLILDEPTNDLDLETLDLLEELLADFQGTLFLVSHDRDFLDRVVTSTLVFEGDGRVGEYVGGYADWLRQRRLPAQTPPPKPPPAAKPRRDRPRRLSFRERQELEQLPARIEQLEAEQTALHTRLADPAFYREAGSAVAEAGARLTAIEGELDALLLRWEELEALAGD
ncbi:MAG: ATP-binding cassette domain-containing protein [Desulfuromonadales bacterium]|nr:ATP-binding cassette domain-containing protein [Desulfuromonadales bacterium]